MILNDSSLNFGPGKSNSTKDLQIVSSFPEIGKEYDVLIFTDSKGVSLQNARSWSEKLVENFNEKGISSLFISRPKEMTVFFTLINFLRLNDIKFKYLITNIGFVDTTPKKEEFINDIIEQSPFSQMNLVKFSLCDYKLSSGELATLYSVNYDHVVEHITKFLVSFFKRVYMIGTFEFSPDIKIQRDRPKEFFSQLKEANRLISSVCEPHRNFEFIHVNGCLTQNEEELSYDAVHFTQEGHDKMFQVCKRHIEL